ncbi:type II secretion system protein [Oceanisphaera sp. IT1-181]|uniref:type II secretion system protein n=1 Tax=Oceanisphaera sp. IT1-181 TaxID=3081199 RepID=UPI0029CA3D1D|nr:type II secretion system protein [Oceanisphaera sp. IT1-181]
MRSARGFGLIEVMVALVLIAVMAAALLPLSQRYLSISRDGRQREVALRLAESKLDELRHFAQQNQPQLVVSGEGSQFIMHTEFSLDWAVHAFNWSSSQQAWQPAVTDAQFSGKQDASVTVAWHNTQGEPQTFTLQTALVALPTLTAGPFGSRP